MEGFLYQDFDIISENRDSVERFIYQNPDLVGQVIHNYEIYQLFPNALADAIGMSNPELNQNFILSLIITNDPILQNPQFSSYLVGFEKLLLHQWEKVNVDDVDLYFPVNSYPLLRTSKVSAKEPIKYSANISYFDEYSNEYLKPRLFKNYDDEMEEDFLKLDDAISKDSVDPLSIYLFPDRVRMLEWHEGTFALLFPQPFILETSGYTLEGREVFVYLKQVFDDLITDLKEDDGLVIFTTKREVFFVPNVGPFISGIPDFDEIDVESIFLLPKFSLWNVKALSYFTYENDEGDVETFRSPIDLNQFLINLHSSRIDLIANVVKEDEIQPQKIYDNKIGLIGI